MEKLWAKEFFYILDIWGDTNMDSLKKKILIVEDEIAVGELLQYYLEKENYEIKHITEGNLALKEVISFKPDIVLLDIMLPDTDGFQVCKAIVGEVNIPIIMITAKSRIDDKLLGLELGADDYISKPFDIKEVVMRIKSVFRRIEITEEELQNRGLRRVNISQNIIVCLDEHKVYKDGKCINLAPKEYELLAFLTNNPNRVFTRDQILDKVWGIDYFGERRTVDIHIQRLRKKLELNNSIPIIETVIGTGYKLNKNSWA